MDRLNRRVFIIKQTAVILILLLSIQQVGYTRLLEKDAFVSHAASVLKQDNLSARIESGKIAKRMEVLSNEPLDEITPFDGNKTFKIVPILKNLKDRAQRFIFAVTPSYFYQKVIFLTLILLLKLFSPVFDKWGRDLLASTILIERVFEDRSYNIPLSDEGLIQARHQSLSNNSLSFMVNFIDRTLERYQLYLPKGTIRNEVAPLIVNNPEINFVALKRLLFLRGDLRKRFIYSQPVSVVYDKGEEDEKGGLETPESRNNDSNIVNDNSQSPPPQENYRYNPAPALYTKSTIRIDSLGGKHLDLEYIQDGHIYFQSYRWHSLREFNSIESTLDETEEINPKIDLDKDLGRETNWVSLVPEKEPFTLTYDNYSKILGKFNDHRGITIELENGTTRQSSYHQEGLREMNHFIEIAAADIGFSFGGNTEYMRNLVDAIYSGELIGYTTLPELYYGLLTRFSDRLNPIGASDDEINVTDISTGTFEAIKRSGNFYRLYQFLNNWDRMRNEWKKPYGNSLQLEYPQAPFLIQIFLEDLEWEDVQRSLLRFDIPNFYGAIEIQESPSIRSPAGVSGSAYVSTSLPFAKAS